MLIMDVVLFLNERSPGVTFLTPEQKFQWVCVGAIAAIFYLLATFRFKQAGIFTPVIALIMMPMGVFGLLFALLAYFGNKHVSDS